MGWVRLLDWSNRKGKALACRITYWTGQAPRQTHPKHLWDAPWHDWYLDHIGPGDVVLDVGCGTGTHAIRAREHGAFIVAAMDKDGEAFHPHIHFVRGDASKEIPWPDGFFTKVLALDILEHIEDRQAFLAEVRRVMTKDGLLLLAVPNSGTSWRRRLRQAGLFSYSDPDHKIEYDWEELSIELWAAGFDWQPAGVTTLDTPWAGVLDAVGACWPRLYREIAQWKWQVARKRPSEATGFLALCRRMDS